MNNAPVLAALGKIFIFVAIMLMIPLALAYRQSENLAGFAVPALLLLTVGIALIGWGERGVGRPMAPNERFALVSLAWIGVSFFGALPYLHANPELSVVDAIFESVSGFTTTGASVLPNVEALPRSLQVWRHLTQWIGGLAILGVFLALLPELGAGSFMSFRRKNSSVTIFKASPKIPPLLRSILITYTMLSCLAILLYHLSGMGWHDAACHALSTVSTGGFSTRNSSIADFSSPAIEWTCALLMFLSAINTLLILRLVRGDVHSFTVNSEFKTYLLFIWMASILLWIKMSLRGGEWEYAGIRLALFHALSFLTTTGYLATDISLWPAFNQMLLFVLMFIGACSGSTAGGVKIFRFLVIFKTGAREIYQFLRPRAVLSIKVNGANIDEFVLRTVLGFICLYFISFGFFATLVVVLEGDRHNIFELISLCIACVSNVGCTLSPSGTPLNFMDLQASTKWLLCLMMLMGRLELYSLLVLLHRECWRR